MTDEYEEKIYNKIREEKNKKLFNNLFKSFGGTIISFYIFMSSIFLGQLFSFMYLFIFNDIKDMSIAYFGEYTDILFYGFLSNALSFLILITAIIGVELYHNRVMSMKFGKLGIIFIPDTYNKFVFRQTATTKYLKALSQSLIENENRRK